MGSIALGFAFLIYSSASFIASLKVRIKSKGHIHHTVAFQSTLNIEECNCKLCRKCQRCVQTAVIPGEPRKVDSLCAWHAHKP